jgi:hypothetical protein
LEFVVGGTRRQVPGGTIAYWSRQERTSVAELGHHLEKTAMEAL